ncbi:MAG: M48 family metallopeptidase [Acidobacteriota bacterium]|nr:M48 family metallopeptidase [Blastocatellia bacterium]MDW8240834.1 M48 family metallopeptidase [Acidobacteriota bacterium]
MRLGRRKLAGLLLALAVIAPAGLSASPKKKPLPINKDPLMIGRRDINKNQINFYSIEKEIALGRQLAAVVEQQLPLLNDPVIAEYVSRIGQNIVLNSDSNFPFNFRVVASDEINAFALPGGFLYINLGVLKAADSEAELAGVIAHEIAHVTARHALENLSKSQLLSLSALPLIFIGGPLGDLGRMGAELGLAAVYFKFSRGAEKEADELSAQYLWACGYDPESLVTFFEKLAARERRVKVSKLFRSHPTTPDRIKHVRKLIAQFPERETYVVNTREFAAIKRDRLSEFGAVAPDIPRSEGQRRPPVLRRGTTQPDHERPTSESRPDTTAPDEHSIDPTSRQAQGRRPPSIVRRTSPEPDEHPTMPDTRPTSEHTDGRQPPRIVRRTSPEEQGEQASSSVNINDQGPSALTRTPPRLRRRF